jgi:hypothetical protein
MVERNIRRANLQELFLEVGTLASVYPYQRAEYKQAYPSSMHSELVVLAPFLLLYEFLCPPRYCEDNVYLRLPMAKASCKRSHGAGAV